MKSLRRRINPFLLEKFGVGIARERVWYARQRSSLVNSLGVTAVLDIGANRGQYAGALRRYGYLGPIHSFEPGSAVFASLAEHASSDPHWHAYPHALGSMDGAAELVTWEGHSSEWSSLKRPTSAVIDLLGQPEFERIQVARADTWLDGHSEIVPESTWVKVDVQGSERDVFEGFGDRLRRFAALEFEAPLGQLYEGEAGLAQLLEAIDAAGMIPSVIATERFRPMWRGAADVDVIAIRKDLSRLPL